jgi:hypothetical protein
MATRDPYRRRLRAKADAPLSPHALQSREAYLSSLGPRRLALELAAISAGPVAVSVLRADVEQRARASQFALGVLAAEVILFGGKR